MLLGHPYLQFAIIMSSTSADVLMDTLQADTIVTCVQAFHSMFKRYLLFIYSNRYTSSVNPVDSTCLLLKEIINQVVDLKM